MRSSGSWWRARCIDGRPAENPQTPTLPGSMSHCSDLARTIADRSLQVLQGLVMFGKVTTATRDAILE